MVIKIQVVELFICKVGCMKDNGEWVIKVFVMAKYYVFEVFVVIVNEVVQIFGGYGYIKDFFVEKYYWDVKFCIIGEGIFEIQKLVIFCEVLKEG